MSGFTSGFGTFETCRLHRAMSAFRGSPEDNCSGLTLSPLRRCRWERSGLVRSARRLSQLFAMSAARPANSWGTWPVRRPWPTSPISTPESRWSNCFSPLVGSDDAAAGEDWSYPQSRNPGPDIKMGNSGSGIEIWRPQWLLSQELSPVRFRRCRCSSRVSSSSLLCAGPVYSCCSFWQPTAWI